ncbi:hypothetical protein QQX98_007665 [Neonectria punicea]|uniref:AT hook domain-containing protein n=1 Tax=Neonectria punicea TaxID=979145 RepID=A0ABR1GX87_9HYPO
MARTKQDVVAAKDASNSPPPIAKAAAGVKKPTGRPRGRPKSDNPRKPYVPTGRPRGRPKGTTKAVAVAKAVDDPSTTTPEAPRRRGRPRKGEASPSKTPQATPKTTPKTTPKSAAKVTGKGTGKRGRPRKNAVPEPEEDQLDAEVEGDVETEDNLDAAKGAASDEESGDEYASE